MRKLVKRVRRTAPRRPKAMPLDTRSLYAWTVQAVEAYINSVDGGPGKRISGNVDYSKGWNAL